LIKTKEDKPMNVNNITQTIEIPGGTGKIRCLSWRQRQEAREEASSKSIKVIADMGGDVMKALRELDDGNSESRENQGSEDLLQGLDQGKVLQFGVMALHENGQQIYSADDQDTSFLDDLHENVAEPLAHAIVSLSGRTADEGKV
jgi:hypothetical protein